MTFLTVLRASAQAEALQRLLGEIHAIYIVLPCAAEFDLRLQILHRLADFFIYACTCAGGKTHGCYYHHEHDWKNTLFHFFQYLIVIVLLIKLFFLDAKVVCFFRMVIENREVSA